MAFADFTVTTFGEQWLAQAVSDGINGTSLATLTAMQFGLADSSTPPGMATLWCDDTAALAAWQGSNAIGIRGVADNIGDASSHQLDFIQILGQNSGTSGVIAYCKSATIETIPPETEQQITRVATVTLAVSGTATVTMATPQTGYALDSEVVKLSPYSNEGGIILSDGAGHSATVDCNAASEVTLSGGLRVGGDQHVSGEIVTTGDITADGDISTVANIQTTNGKVSGPNLPLFALVSRASSGDEYSGIIDGESVSMISAATVLSKVNAAANNRGIFICVDSVSSAGVAPKCVPIGYAVSMAEADFPWPPNVGGCVQIVRYR